MFIDAESFKGYVPSRPEVWLHRAWDEDRALHPQVLDPTLHDRQFHRDHARHLDRAAEGNLPVPLTEMQVPDTEFCARHMDREVGLRAAR